MSATWRMMLIAVGISLANTAVDTVSADEAPTVPTASKVEFDTTPPASELRCLKGGAPCKKHSDCCSGKCARPPFSNPFCAYKK